jgi:hypothetical protein
LRGFFLLGKTELTLLAATTLEFQKKKPIFKISDAIDYPLIDNNRLIHPAINRLFRKVIYYD